MANKNFIFTSESVSEGHPDKVADQISDAVVDALIGGDPASRVACETLVKNNTVILAGEITSNASVDYAQIVRDCLSSIGYTDPTVGFDAEGCEIIQYINKQSSDISQGVTEGQGSFAEQGAGDQGMMFGFACNETPELMPLPIALAHDLVRELACRRKSGKAGFLRPDSKAQVSVRYEAGRPVKIETIVVSTQHSEQASLNDVRQYIAEELVPAVIPPEFLSKEMKLLVNPTGRFVIGGPVGDCGLTGRKIIVDTYGGYSRHGGGAFSGKDPTKVDRSAAYCARYIAKNIVAAGLAEKCEVQLAYAIGVAEPISVFIDTFGTGRRPEAELASLVRDSFKMTPKGIIESLALLKPIYQEAAAYGHFGRSPSSTGHFSWERTDKAERLAKSA